MSTFYVLYDALAPAERALRELLSDGVSTDSLSMVARATADEAEAVDAQIRAETGHLEDASFIVGRDDDPLDVPDPDDPNRIRYVVESEIGTGISSHHRDDAVLQVEEMDESQEAAESMTSPPEDRPTSRHEYDDIQLTLDTGFPTPVPSIDPVSDIPTPIDLEAAEALDTIAIPGFGVVAGGGALSTAALDLADADRERARANFLRHLTDEGVPGDEAARWLDTFLKGGAVVAVEVVPGDVDPTQLEVFAERTGALESGLFDAPRF